MCGISTYIRSQYYALNPTRIPRLPRAKSEKKSKSKKKKKISGKTMEIVILPTELQ